MKWINVYIVLNKDRLIKWDTRRKSCAKPYQLVLNARFPHLTKIYMLYLNFQRVKHILTSGYEFRLTNKSQVPMNGILFDAVKLFTMQSLNPFHVLERFYPNGTRSSEKKLDRVSDHDQDPHQALRNVLRKANLHKLHLVPAALLGVKLWKMPFTHRQ